MNATMKRAENKTVKTLLTGLNVAQEETAKYTDIRVSHGRGTASGWLDVEVSINTPTDCFCDEGWNGRCSNCADKWADNYRTLKDAIKKQTGRQGQYDGNIQVMIRLI